MIPKILVNKLQDLPIGQVAESLGYAVSNNKCLCPFHDDTRPSLTLNRKTNRYHCFVCGAQGNTIRLVMKSQGWNFHDACRWLAKQFNVPFEDFSSVELKPREVVKKQKPEVNQVEPFYLRGLIMHRHQLTNAARKFLFDERKISPQVVEALGLSSIDNPVPMSSNMFGSWFNAPSLLIPYYDVDNNLLTVQARYLGDKKDLPRFQFPKGSNCQVFNLPVLKTLKEGDELWITEGVSDCLAMLSAGKKAIAIPSATLLKPKMVETMRFFIDKTSKISLHMYPDNDKAGASLFFDLQKMFPKIVHHSLPQGVKDFGEYWKLLKG